MFINIRHTCVFKKTHNNFVYFLAICVNFPCKIEKFELEVRGVGILGTRFWFQEIY